MNIIKTSLLFVGGAILGIILLVGLFLFQFEQKYREGIFPGVFIDGEPAGGQTIGKIEAYFQKKNEPLKKTTVTLRFEDETATLSAQELAIFYDGKLAGTQAFSYGRGQNPRHYIFLLNSFVSFILNTNQELAYIESMLSYNKDAISEKLELLKDHIDITPIEPQFEFDKDTNRVLAFKLGKDGRALDTQKALETIESMLEKQPAQVLTLDLPVATVEPKTGDRNIDNLGISERIGTGLSYYKGSIPGRVHNVVLAATRADGVLVAPGDVFSFNDTVGDISAATGYKTAYIIKNGRTVLGDGGGVCQVSTTLFRAALNSGLEVVERKPHSYRVSYYEQGGFKPGLDATVFAPSVDLKIKNTTDHYILIHAIPEPENYKLTYEIYGKKDGRTVELSEIKMLSQSPAPPPLYQEDPTLPNGQIKQVDFAASGAKTTFDYKVVKDGQVLGASTFVNNFKPWQAVYLYGPGTTVPTQ